MITVHKKAETIQGRKLFKGGNYFRKYGRCFLHPGKVIHSKNGKVIQLTLITVHKSAETIQGRKLFKGGNYFRRYGRCFLHPGKVIHSKNGEVIQLTLITVHKSAETIQGRKLFKGGNYLRTETIFGNTVGVFYTLVKVIHSKNGKVIQLTLITVHKSAETIQGRKLFKGGNYFRRYSRCFLHPMEK